MQSPHFVLAAAYLACLGVSFLPISVGSQVLLWGVVTYLAACRIGFSMGAFAEGRGRKKLGLPQGPFEPNRYSVAMHLFRDGLLVGSDHGVLSLRAGAIRFEGQDSEAVIPPRYVAGMSEEPHRVALRLHYPRENLTVTFSPRVAGYSYDVRAMVPNVRVFLTREAASDVPALYPPVEVHPQHRRYPLARPLEGLALMLTLALFTLQFFFYREPAAVCSALALLIGFAMVLFDRNAFGVMKLQDEPLVEATLSIALPPPVILRPVPLG